VYTNPLDTSRNYYGVGGVTKVSDPAIPDEQPCLDDPDPNKRGVDHFYSRYAVSGHYQQGNVIKSGAIEAGWIEYGRGQPLQQDSQTVLVALQPDRSVNRQTYRGADIVVHAGDAVYIRIEHSIASSFKWYVWARVNNQDWRKLFELPGWAFDEADYLEAFFEHQNLCSRRDFGTGSPPNIPTLGTNNPAAEFAIRVLLTPNRRSRPWTEISKAWTPTNFPSVANGGPTRTNSKVKCIGVTTICYEADWTAYWHGVGLRNL
jgi:hypothetical protein